MTFCLIAASGWLLAGCGDSSNKPTPPAPSGAAPTAGSGAADEVKKVVTEVATETKKQATEMVAAVQKQAVESYQNFSSQIASSLQSNSDSTLKNISADLSTRVSKFGDSIKTNGAVKAQLSSAMESLLGKNDAEAVSGLGKLTDLKLSPEQSTLAKEVYNAGAALVTQRNFSSLEGMNSEVTTVVNSVWKGNYSQALPPLQKIWTQAKLTDSQKNLLGTTFDKYSPGWRDNAATVQKGLDTLKGFTK